MNKIRNSILWLALLLSCPAWATHTGSGGIGGAPTAGPINTESAITLPKGKWSVGLRTEFVKFDRLTDAEMKFLRENDPEADLHSITSLSVTSASASYGLTENFTIGLRIPYVIRNDIKEPEHEHGVLDIAQEESDHDTGESDHDVGDADHDDGESDHDDGDSIADTDHDAAEPAEVVVLDLGNADGLGDMIFFGQYRFFHNETKTMNASALFGFKAPTGNTHEASNQGVRLETELQPGSGSWDGILGLSYTQIIARLSLNASAVYTIVSEGSQSTDLGDVFNYNAAIAYRIGSGEPGLMDITKGEVAWDLVLELNGQWRDKQTASGIVDGNSGGNQLYFSPGVRFIGSSLWNIGVSFGVPLISDFNGTQDDLDYRVIGALNFNF